MRTYNERTKVIRLNAAEAEVVLSFDPLSPSHRLVPRKIGEDLFIMPLLARSKDFPIALPDELRDLIASLPDIELTTLDYGYDFMADSLPSDFVDLLMPAKAYTPGERRYDRPPLPPEGEAVQVALFTQVALAITAWGHLEASLAWLFGRLVGAKSASSAILSAFGAVGTVSVRLNMIELAANAVFIDTPMPDLERDFFALKKDINNLAQRRNEIAHGCVASYKDSGVAVQPPAYPTKQMTFIEGNAPIPAYAYTTAEVAYFENEFREAEKRVYLLTTQIGGQLDKKNG